jgi:hypothetical protein
MDVAPRSAFVAGVVPVGERTAAMGVVNIAKTLDAATGPLLTGWVASRGLFSWAFYLCGGLKCVYDISLYVCFRDFEARH